MLRKHTSDPQIGTFLSSVDWPNASDASVRRDDLGSNAGWRRGDADDNAGRVKHRAKLGKNGDLPRKHWEKWWFTQETLGKMVIYPGNIGKNCDLPRKHWEILLKRNTRPFKEWLMIRLLHVITPQPYYSIVNRYSTLQPT